MRLFFIKPFWWALMLLAGTLLVACGNSNATSALVDPAPDRPTFVWIFSDPWPQWDQMRPIVNGLEAEYGGQIDFRRYNILTDEGNAWATGYGLRGHPAFVLVNEQGQEQWRTVGVVPEETMEAALTAILSSGEGQ